MTFKHFFITAASCMAILGSGVSYADATASWHATTEHHRQAKNEESRLSAPIQTDNMLKRLDKALTGELALTDEQREQIQALADRANKQINLQRIILSDAQQGLDALHQEKIISSEQFKTLHCLLNQRALAMSDVMFEKQQFFISVNNVVLAPAQSEVVEKRLKEKRNTAWGENYREDPNRVFSAQRQRIG